MAKGMILPPNKWRGWAGSFLRQERAESGSAPVTQAWSHRLQYFSTTGTGRLPQLAVILHKLPQSEKSRNVVIARCDSAIHPIARGCGRAKGLRYTQ